MRRIYNGYYAKLRLYFTQRNIEIEKSEGHSVHVEGRQSKNSQRSFLIILPGSTKLEVVAYTKIIVGRRIRCSCSGRFLVYS